MELPQDFCCGVCNLLSLEIFLGGVFLQGVGGKLHEELSLQFDSFVMLKTGWVIKLWWGDSICGENN